MKMAARLEAMGSPIYAGMTKKVNGNVVWTGKVEQSNWGQIIKPLSWKKPRMVFVNSMSDLFHEAIPDSVIDIVFAVMALCPQHKFQVLTKRAERMLTYVTELSKRHTPDGNMQLSPQVVLTETAMDMGINLDYQNTSILLLRAWPLPNVWLGVSCERQKEADERIPLLLQTPAAVRFISAEPLLGPIDLERGGFSLLRPTTSPSGRKWPGLNWVIAGGESGPNARPMHPQWAQGLRDQCAAAGVPFFFKQRGEFTWVDDADYDASAIPELPHNWRDRADDKFICMKSDGARSSGYGGDSSEFLYRVGKKRAGRKLDGREHNEFPAAVAA